MAYQDDFRNKVIAALKKKNLAVDLSEEQTQEAIVQEIQIVAQNEPTPISPEEMRKIIQDVAKEVAAENKVFTAQSNNFRAFDIVLEGPLSETEGSYSGGGIAVSVANKDIVIIPANGGLGAAGIADSVNSISQIDFKHIANPNAYASFDPKEVKASLFNWAERIVGTTYDTPVLGIGGAWGGVSYAPTAQWGVGNSRGSGIGGSINQVSGFGQIIFFKPATSTIYSSLFNDVAISNDFANKYITLIGYQSALPGVFPTAGFAISFGGIGGSGPLAITGAANAAQSNRVRFLSPLTILNSTVTDTLTLGLSSTGIATTHWFVGGNGQTSNAYVLSTQAPTFNLGDMFFSGGTGHTTLRKLDVGGNGNYLTISSGVPTWTASIGANSVNVNAATGSTLMFPVFVNASGNQVGIALSSDVNYFVDPATNTFYAGSAISSSTYTGTGSLAIKPGANATTAITLQKADGTNILVVDTTNNLVGINKTPATYALDVSGDTNVSGVYRIGNTQILSSTTLSNVTASVLTSVGIINSGTWSATAITTNYGGTGFQTYAVGDILYASTANSLGKLTVGTINQFLSSNGSIPTWVSGTGLTVGTAFKITTAQTNVATTLYPLFADASTGAIGASIDLNIVYNAAGNILTVPNVYSGTALSSPLYTSDASLAIRPGANATTAIALQKANGTNILVVDTTNDRIGINMTPGSFALDVTGSANLSSTNAYNIAGASVLNATTLGTNVVTSSLTTVGTIGTGRWQGSAVGTTYGGTGSNLGGAIGNSNKVVITGTIANGYAATLIDGANTGYLLAAQGNASAPSFVNTTNAAFSFASGSLTINNAVITTGTITGVPTNGTDIVNKTYADSISAGLDIHDSARLTTVSAIGGSYRQAGTAGTLSGFGDYIIATTPATLIGSESGFDVSGAGIALTNGQRVLVKDGVLGGYASGSGAYGAYPTTYGGFAASWVANGIYEVASYGGAATSGWLLVRAIDSDNQNGFQELTGGTFTFVEEGVTYADNAFVCTNDTALSGAIGFGVTQISWSPFSGGASLTAGQGIAKSGNTLATNFNFTNDGNIVSGITYQGFAIGGARSGGVGFSSRTTLTVTAQGGANAVAASTLTLNTTGFTLSGGVTSRSITVQGAGNVTLDGGGNTLTLGSSSTASFNSQTLALTSSMQNLTFNAGNTTPAASTQNIVQSGAAQYNLSTSDTNYLAGDLYYGAGTAYTALLRLGFTAGTGNSVLIRGANAPAWGTIALANSNFVSGVLAISNGGTNNGSLSVAGGQVVYTDGTKLAATAAGTADQFLKSAGSGAPTWSAITLSNTTSVTGTLGISNGGTNATATPTNGGVSYGTGSAYAFTGAGTGNSVLLSTGAGAPIWGAVVLSSANSVTGTLGISNGGTNSTATPTAGGAVYGTGSAYAITAAGTAGSVLMSTAAGAPVWQQITLSNTNSVSGTLAIANGGTNAAAANFTSNGVVIYDSGNTRLASATGATLTGGTGLSVTGTVAASSGFFIAGNSVVTNVAGIYGAVTISSAASNGGTSYLSTSSQSLVLNYPGTGITGTGAVTQVPYYNASSTLTGDVGLVYSRTAASGIGLSLNVNATTGTILRINSAQTFTSGLLLDIDNSGVQALSVDFKGMTSITAASGNTALVVSGGRTILPAPTANYASLNLAASSAVNPGNGVTQIGDLWFNGTNLYFRKDATTSQDLLIGSVSGSGTANKVVKWNTSTSLTDSNITDAGTGMTITSSSAVGAGGGSTAVLTLQTVLLDNSLTDRYFVRGITSTGTRLFSVDTAGNLRATTKSFDIPHPTKEGKRLVYGVLEGPEHGVYHRGTAEGKGIIQINLPDYWHKLVGDQYTIQLTPWGNYNVCIESKTENYFTIQLVGDLISRKFKNIKVDYIVHGSRLDAPLETEQ